PPRARLGALCRLLVGLQALDRRDHAAAVLATLLLLRLEVLEEPRLDDDAAHLAGDRAQEPHLVTREPAAAERLDHQHAHRRAALGDRDADEGMVFLLAGLREVLVPGMRDGIDRHHRLALLDHHAGETCLDAHRHLADGALLEPRRRPEREALRARVEDVQRAHLRPHALGDHLDDALERLLEILRARGDRADVLENGETVGAAGLRPAGARTAALAALGLHRGPAILAGRLQTDNGGRAAAASTLSRHERRTARARRRPPPPLRRTRCGPRTGSRW